VKVDQDSNVSSAAAQAAVSYQQRLERGRAARGVAPRGGQAEWAPASDRPDPIDLLEAQARDRLPDLIPIRYSRMMASPFAFMRGSAIVMANDLAGTPKTGIQVQLCGDAHLLNFGAYASPERALLFDINDFDETLPGPWEWDVKRLAASLVVAGRDNGFDAADCRRAAQASVASYRRRMAEFAEMRELEGSQDGGLPESEVGEDQRRGGGSQRNGERHPYAEEAQGQSFVLTQGPEVGARSIGEEYDREGDLAQQQHGVLVERELGETKPRGTEDDARRDKYKRCREERSFQPARNEAEGEHDGGQHEEINHRMLRKSCLRVARLRFQPLCIASLAYGNLDTLQSGCIASWVHPLGEMRWWVMTNHRAVHYRDRVIMECMQS